MTSPDLSFDWIPLKAYAVDRGKSTRTIRRWIRLGKLEAMRDGPMDQAPWLIKVIRPEKQKAS